MALGYGSGVASGPVVIDQWCMSNSSDTCDKNMKFVNAVKTSLSILKCSGVVGLSPKPARTTDLFIQKMKDNGIISKMIFSFSIGTGFYKNQMTFGGYNATKFATGPVQWHKVSTKGNFWLANISSVSLIWPGALKPETSSSGQSAGSGEQSSYNGYNSGYSSNYGNGGNYGDQYYYGGSGYS